MLRQSAPARIALSPSEFGKQVGVGKTLIYEQIKIGVLPARKIGTRTVILAEEGEEWLKNRPKAKRLCTEDEMTIASVAVRRTHRRISSRKGRVS